MQLSLYIETSHTLSSESTFYNSSIRTFVCRLNSKEFNIIVKQVDMRCPIQRAENCFLLGFIMINPIVTKSLLSTFGVQLFIYEWEVAFQNCVIGRMIAYNNER
jgi:hypothetical protein